MNTIPEFIMMVGLPASGKSTYAEKLAKRIDADLHSTDEIRKEICGDENSQEKNDEVFQIVRKRIKDSLKSGRNTIYDATNIHSTYRMAFLNELENEDIECITTCKIMRTPFNVCLRRNSQRDREVPNFVIERMYKNWNTPYWFEGWDNIDYVSTGCEDDKDIFNWIQDYLNYEQDNSHHSYTLGQHCIEVASKFNNNMKLYCAGLLHDCGKPYTKSFFNSQGEETNEAHYYQHHCVGAYDSLFFKYPERIDSLDISILINLHMFPYFWENDKYNGERTREKYKKLWGSKLYNEVMRLHIADKESH